MRHPSPLVEIVSTGRYLPDQIVTNDDLARRMDTSDEWIRTRTGIRARRIAPDGVGAAFMAAEAASDSVGLGAGPGRRTVASRSWRPKRAESTRAHAASWA